MHTYSLVSKPPEASGVFNGLLAAVVAGQSYGEANSALSFENQEIFDNPDGAPRGFNNAKYSVVPHASDIDPTSYMALASETAFRRAPIGTVGYTHDHVAVELLSHISAMFARWYTELDVLYAAASTAQKEMEQGMFQKIDETREVRYGAGHISDYLAAVGSLSDGNISYPASRTIDVDVIHARIKTALTENLGVLDHIGYSMGESMAKKHIGLSSYPKTGYNMKVLQASTYDNIVSARWARLLTCPRSREILRPVFEERFASLDPGSGKGAAFYKLLEGNGTLYIPDDISDVDAMLKAIDQRPKLSDAVYEISSGAFKDNWLNQFYTKGDLVVALLKGDVDVLKHDSVLSVLLSNPIADGTNNVILGPVDYDTGALGSYNIITKNAVNPITGSINVMDTVATGTSKFTFVGLDMSSMDTVLPNGILDIGSCGEATALNWIEILRHLNLNYPQRVRSLMEAAGRSKKTLPSSVNRIASPDQLISSAIANGQRDGYINSPALAFNVTRKVRSEQEGPTFAASRYSPVDEGHKSVSSYMVSDLNGWDRTDTSTGKYIVDTNGQLHNIDKGVSSRFTGEWDAGRYATWRTDFAADTIAAGTPNIEARVAENLLSLPFGKDVNGGVTLRTVPSYASATSTFNNTIAEWYRRTSTAGVLAPHRGSQSFAEVENLGDEAYNHSWKWESYHPTRGFMRGLATVLPSDTNIVGAGYHGPHEATGLKNRGRISSFTSTLLTGPGVTVFTTSNYTNGPMFGTSKQAPGLNWFWDPTRAQIFGKSWHRWSGHFFNGVLPHPYAPHPIAVPTSVCRITDLVGDDLPTEQVCGAELHSATTTPAWEALTGGAIPKQFSRSGTHSPEQGTMKAALATNQSTSWPAAVSSRIAMALQGSSSSWDYAADTLSGIQENQAYIPAMEYLFLVRNGCQSSVEGAATAVGVMDSLNDAAVAPMGGYSTGVMRVPLRMEGEVLTNSIDGSVDRTLQIRGKGLLFAGDMYSVNSTSVMAWMAITYAREATPINGPIRTIWGNTTEQRTFLSMEAPNVGTNFMGDISGSILSPTSEKFAVTKALNLDIPQFVGVSGVKNDWFRKSETLSDLHSRMRAMIPNPWNTGSGVSGYAHLRYENDQVGPIYTAFQGKLLNDGRAGQAGLKNTDFLSIQQAN